MPIYEYFCDKCGAKITILIRSFNKIYNPVCSKCGNDKPRKLVSKVSVIKSEESRLENLSESMFSDVDENDPRSVAQWARKMGKELGEDAGEDFDEMIDRIEAGEDVSDFDNGYSDLD